MPREIMIRPVLNGFVCNVGCQVVVFTDTKSLGRAVEEYFDKPEETEKRYLEKAINRMTPPCPEPCPPPPRNLRGDDAASCGQQMAETPIRR